MNALEMILIYCKIKELKNKMGDMDIIKFLDLNVWCTFFFGLMLTLGLWKIN